MNRGIVLILTLLILTGLIALALGIATLLTREIKLSQEMANSVLAYGAADTGIERFLYGVNKEALDPATCVCATLCYSDTLSNDASYEVCVITSTPPVTVKSTGTYRSTNRSIQITY